MILRTFHFYKFNLEFIDFNVSGFKIYLYFSTQIIH